MAANPSPTRITAAMWWLVEQLLALEPGTLLGGIYANKSGYHSTGDDNERTWPGNYSIRDVEDRRGLNWRTKAAGLDWTFPEAQRGDYRRMARYGARLKAAFDARDPRLTGWREALGQTDLDAAPEGLDFRRWFTRVPDDTHMWHWHFSEDREQVENLNNKRALLSVLTGQTLAQWQGDAVSAQDVWNHTISSPALGQSKSAADWMKELGWIVGDTRALRAELAAARSADEARDKATLAAIQALASAGGIDAAPIVAAVNAVRDEAREKFAALHTALAAAEAERDALQARLAAALGQG